MMLLFPIALMAGLVTLIVAINVTACRDEDLSDKGRADIKQDLQNW